MQSLEQSHRDAIARWRPFIWAALGSILLAPAIAMQFSTEVKWDVADFIAAAVLLSMLGAAFELAVRMSSRLRIRALIAGGALFVVLAVWANAAVGILN